MTPKVQNELVMGELVSDRKPNIRPLVCLAKHVIAMQTSRKGSGFCIEERLYRFTNGAAIGARRGGPLHLADGDSWEMFVLNPMGFRNGDPVGWIKDDQLARLVKHMADLVAAS